MARKKKTEDQIIKEVSKLIAEETLQATEPKKRTKQVKEAVTDNNWPKVVKGSHLTVTTHQDGKTELTWDDEALARDVREAIASVESKGENHGKKARKTKQSK